MVENCILDKCGSKNSVTNHVMHKTNMFYIRKYILFKNDILSAMN
jgi:hypothetical protein